MGGDKRLIDAGVLNFEFLEVVDVDNGVAELVEVALDILERILVESKLLKMAQLGLFVFHGLDVKFGIIFAVTVIHTYNIIIQIL